MEESSVRVVRRHERTHSQASNIYTGVTAEGKKEMKTFETDSLKEIEENLKPYSERKQFWETVTSHPEGSKRSSLIKSETESDTDTCTEGTVVEKKKEMKFKPLGSESSDSENDPSSKKSDPSSVYENAGFMGAKIIDDSEEQVRRPTSPYEVQRNEATTKELPSPEDISLKDVKTKRDIFEKEIQRQSLEYEESISRRSMKQSSSEDSSSDSKQVLPEDQEDSLGDVSFSSTEKGKVVESTITATDKQELESSGGIPLSKSEAITSQIQSAKIETLSSFDKASSLNTSSEKSDSLDRSSDIYSSSIDKSSSLAESTSSDMRSGTVTSSIDDDDDVTRTGESSDDETTTAEDKPVNPEKSLTEERRLVGGLEEVVIRETTTTRAGGQEQRVVKETKTQETQLADGSTVKSTSITTFTTQLENADDKEKSKVLEHSESQERQQVMLEQQVKSDIFKEEICSPSDELSPEHKVITQTTTDSLPVTSIKQSSTLSSPIHLPEQSIQDIVWETSLERSEIPEAETVEAIPDQNLEQELVKNTSVKSEHFTGIHLTEAEARTLALEIIEHVKAEALKRSPSATPSKAAKISYASRSDSSSSSFSEEAAQKIDQFIQEQLADESNDTKKALLDSIEEHKEEILQQKASQYNVTISEDEKKNITYASSIAEEQIDKHAFEEDDTLRSVREPSEADESECSMIIHDTMEDSFTNEYDQATQMISKTLDTIKTVNLKGEPERAISTISEEVTEIDSSIVDKRGKSETSKICSDDRTIIDETGEVEAKIYSQVEIAQVTKSKEIEITGMKPMKTEILSKDVKSVSNKMDKIEKTDGKDVSIVISQRSLDLHKDTHMESSMTESMEECSAAESTRAYELRATEVRKNVITEVKETEETPTEKQPEVVMRRKSPVDSSSYHSKTEGDTASSSGESHYYTAEGTSDSHVGSRPCSSDVEALLSGTTGTTGTSEYETALSSQEVSYVSRASTVSEYKTAASSISSRDSMKSVDSESSGNLGSIELSEASETLVPSSFELERDMEILDQEILEEEYRRSHHGQIIPQLTIQSETPKTEDSPSCFDIDSDEMDDSELKEEDQSFIPSKMKRSVEMTFHPDLKALEDSDGAEQCTPADETTLSVTETKVISSLEESTISDGSTVTVVSSGSIITTDIPAASSLSDKNEASFKNEENVPSSSHDQQMVTSSSIDSDQVHSVTISTTSVPSSAEQATVSICTQVTSEIKDEKDSFFRIEGPAEEDEVAKLKEVTESRPVAAPINVGVAAGPPEGPDRVVAAESFDTEADQEYKHMYNGNEFAETNETELQCTLEEDDDLLLASEPHERPRTPEPGYVPPQKKQFSVGSDEGVGDDMTEVDQRFSAVFSMAYEEENNSDVPNITITEHMAPMSQQYPDLEREEDFPECRASLASSQSSVTSPKSSTTDSDVGREYCLDSQTNAPGSFELVEFNDIVDISEFEQTLMLHDKRVKDITQIKEEDQDEETHIENGTKISPPIGIPQTLKAVKVDTCSVSSSDSQSLEGEELNNQYESSIEEQRRWLEMQFEQNNEGSKSQEFSPPKFMDHVFSGPLEDIIEDPQEDPERRDLAHVVKGTSLSSTPEYDVLAGRKFFTRSGEHDDISMASLQEFERLEREMALETAARRSSSGSQESLNGKRPISKSSQGDDVSVASLNSLNEFENLEKQCLSAEQIEKKAQEEAALLSEIEEGHESQLSESESCETMSNGKDDSDDENYDDRMFQIDEIIRQAQDNVEKFEGVTTSYQGVRLKDIVSVDGSTVSSDRSPSVGQLDDPDSLEESVKLAETPQIDIPLAKGTSQDSLEREINNKQSERMTTSADSLEFNLKEAMTTSIDSLENKKKSNAMTVSSDSIERGRPDVMASSIDSLGRDDSSGREGDISSASEMVRPLGTGQMEWSTDSLEPSSSQATHATYHDNDSVMSSSFASGCSNTLIGSMEDSSSDLMTASMYIPEGELPTDELQRQYSLLLKSGEAITSEIVAPSTEPGFSHTVSRSVALPPEIRQVKFIGNDAQEKMKEYMDKFNEGEHVDEEETVDESGNVHVRRVVQRRIIMAPEETKELGFTLSDPSTEETVTQDEFGNVTRVIKRTVVSTHTMEIDLDTGEPILSQDNGEFQDEPQFSTIEEVTSASGPVQSSDAIKDSMQSTRSAPSGEFVSQIDDSKGSGAFKDIPEAGI